MNENLTFDQLPEAVSILSTKVSELTRLFAESLEQKPSNKPEQLLTVQQAATFLNLSVPTIYSKVSKRELPVMKRSKRLYFSSTELLEYIKVGRKKSNAEIDAEGYFSNTKKGLK